MKLAIASFVEHRARSVQPALTGFGLDDAPSVLAPGGSTCSSAGSSCSCSCGALVTPES